MANIFLVSDTHFGHENILTFENSKGEKLRPGFKDAKEMDEYMIEKWNSVVKPTDKVYHLGDVAMHKQSVETIARCNGKKRLVRGNHDEHGIKRYLRYFEEVYATRILDHMLLSHIPVHPDCVGKHIANVHGHVHNNVPDLYFGPQYYNVSVEVIDYTPIPLEEVKQRILARYATAAAARAEAFTSLGRMAIP